MRAGICIVGQQRTGIDGQHRIFIGCSAVVIAHGSGIRYVDGEGLAARRAFVVGYGQRCLIESTLWVSVRGRQETIQDIAGRIRSAITPVNNKRIRVQQSWLHDSGINCNGLILAAGLIVDSYGGCQVIDLNLQAASGTDEAGGSERTIRAGDDVGDGGTDTVETVGDVIPELNVSLFLVDGGEQQCVSAHNIPNYCSLSKFMYGRKFG